MTETAKPNPDMIRTILLIYGALGNGTPFWAYAAVKPSRYQPMLNAQKEGRLNLYQFGEYGEIIVSGEGKSPPDSVTIKVAELYQTDPAQMLARAPKDAK